MDSSTSTPAARSAPTAAFTAAKPPSAAAVRFRPVSERFAEPGT